MVYMYILLCNRTFQGNKSRIYIYNYIYRRCTRPSVFREGMATRG